MVAESVCGTFDEIQKDIQKEPNYTYKRTLMSVQERYEEITSTWAGYTGDDFSFNDYSYGQEQPYVSEPKIGRNDPCPCGSGKKYKKCCLNA
jgi:preprotein translocase subunit SecA